LFAETFNSGIYFAINFFSGTQYKYVVMKAVRSCLYSYIVNIGLPV